MKTGTSTLLKCLHRPLFDVVWSLYCLDISWSSLSSQTKVPDERRPQAQVEISFDFSENKILIWFQSFPAEKAKKKASDKNKKSGFVVNKQARAVEEDEIPNKSKKSSKKAPPPAPKVRTNMRKTLQGGVFTVPPELQNWKGNDLSPTKAVVPYVFNLINFPVGSPTFSIKTKMGENSTKPASRVHLINKIQASTLRFIC